jgi:DNA polymerase elongation subunit (family B)
MELGREMVIYDLETAPWLAWCYGNQYEPVVAKEVVPTKIISIAYCFGDGPVRFKSIWDFPGFKSGFPEKIDDKKLVTFIRDEVLNKASIAVGHNSDGFDLKTINERIKFHNLTPPNLNKTYDTLKMYRKYLKNPSNKLGYLSDKYGYGGKLPHEGVSMFIKAMSGDVKQQKVLEKYNKIDVERTRSILKDILPFEQRLKPVWGKEQCHKCQGYNTRKRGQDYFKKLGGIYQTFSCTDCGARWPGNRVIEKLIQQM